MAATRDQLDAIITTLVARISNVISDFQAKINAGTPPEDFQPEVDKLQAMVDALNVADPDNSNNGDASNGGGTISAPITPAV